MSATHELMQLAMVKGGLTSRYQLAMALGVSQQRIANWHKGNAECDIDAAVKLANLAGLPAGYAALLVAAGKSKSASVKTELLKAAERLAS